MKYKGFIIEIVYLPGSDFTVKNGIVKDRRPSAKDIDYYQIIDPLDNNKNLWRENTIKDCKNTIDTFLINSGLNKNM